MGARKINKILIAVSIVLGITFVGCLVFSICTPFFSFIDTLSAISSFFVAVLTIIYVYTTSKQMDFMKQINTKKEINSILEDIVCNNWKKIQKGNLKLKDKRRRKDNVKK